MKAILLQVPNRFLDKFENQFLPCPFSSLESELARQTFESQATEKLMAVKAILPKMSRNFWRCDPDEHVEGQTFVRMTNLLQVNTSLPK